MGLGNRSARQHETVAVRKAAVVSEDFADFNVGQRVMTVDGFPGVVGTIEDGPYPGTEAYRVTLDNGMGGGLYRTSDLQTMNQTTASEHHTADQDYPELGDILTQRPDIAKCATLDGSIDPNRRVKKMSTLTPGDFNKLHHVPAHSLKPGDRFFNPGLGVGYHTAPNGAVSSAMGFAPMEGHSWRVDELEQGHLTATHEDSGKQKDGPIPEGHKVLKFPSGR